jgi:hypothetical protein
LSKKISSYKKVAREKANHFYYEVKEIFHSTRPTKKFGFSMNCRAIFLQSLTCLSNQHRGKKNHDKMVKENPNEMAFLLELVDGNL